MSAVSRFTAERTRSLFALDRTPAVIYNGIDVTRFPEPDAPPEPGLIVHLGTLVRKKGIIDLTEAFSGVLESCPSARLIVAGRDCPDRRTGASSTWDLARAALSPAARERVDAVGPVEQDAVAPLLARATLCVFPSHAEANPVAWLEAMAAGRPIVGYAHGWATEIIDDGVTGWLVPPGDTAAMTRAIVEALAHPENLRSMGLEARAVAERRFSTDATVDASVRWYQQIRAGSSGNGTAPR